MPFRALTFDCYGTLVDWEAGLLAVLEPWVARHGRSIDAGDLLERFALVESRLERERPALPYTEILRAAHSQLAGQLDLPPDDGEATRLADSIGHWPVFPDTVDALGRLATRFRLVLVSNVDARGLEATTPRLGVDFDAVVTAEEVGAYKPDPRMFVAARERLEALGCDLTSTLHVAQSLFHDHVPARRLGFKTAWVDRRRGTAGWGATPPPPEPVSPDLVVASLAELAAHLGV